MCSLYSVDPSSRTATTRLENALGDAIRQLTDSRIYPGRPGIALRAQGSDPLPTLMSWGFERPEFSKRPLNNARDDKLTGRVWGRAFRERRCVIPARWFVEWRTSPASPGRKQPLGIWAGPDNWLWMAGLWEEKEGKLCYTMVTTSPSPQIGEFHDRMPAILADNEIGRWLECGDAGLIRPYAGSLEIVPLRNPQGRPDDPPPPPAAEQQLMPF